MTDLNQKIKEFARKAYELDALADYGEWTPNLLSEELLKSMHGVFVEFARLVAEDCAMTAYQTSDIEALAALKTQRDELLEALKGVLPFMATETTNCHGDTCRERWCSSCFAEEDAEIAAEMGRTALMAARNALAKVGVQHEHRPRTAGAGCESGGAYHRR